MMEKTGWNTVNFGERMRGYAEGNYNLGQLFIWENTDQGHDFWEAQHNDGLDIEGAKALLEMVQYWKEQQTVASNYEAGLSGKESV